MNYCVILWLMTTNDLWFLFGISLGELSAVSRGHSSSGVPGLSMIPAHPPFLDIDRGWWCALFTQQWREKPYFLLYTPVSFLPSFKWDVCREKAPDGGASLFQPRSVLVCKDLIQLLTGQGWEGPTHWCTHARHLWGMCSDVSLEGEGRATLTSCWCCWGKHVFCLRFFLRLSLEDKVEQKSAAVMSGYFFLSPGNFL